MFLIHLHLFHQIVLQETFDVLQVFFSSSKIGHVLSMEILVLAKTSRAMCNTNNKSSRDSEYRITLDSIP